MAEKEERYISITQMVAKENIETEKYRVMPRQEAIECIAKALIRADYPNAQESIWAMRWNNPASKDYYLIMANAALNSLLEGK